MNNSVNHQYDSYSPERIIKDHLATARRLLIFGESGIGKSTLAAQLTLRLKSQGRDVSLLSADPGSPDFGIPGAVCQPEHGAHFARTRTTEVPAIFQ